MMVKILDNCLMDIFSNVQAVYKGWRVRKMLPQLKREKQQRDVCQLATSMPIKGDP